MPRLIPLRTQISIAISRFLPKSSLSSTPNLGEYGSLASRLSSRAVIRFSGADTARYLQNLLTNDVLPLAGAPSASSGKSSYLSTPNVALYHPSPVYTALLTPQGRFLYDLFLYRPSPAGEKLDRSGSGPGRDEKGEELAIFADVDKNFLDEILNCFRRYSLRSKIEIENVSEDFSCWQRFGSNLSDTATQSATEPEATSIGWGKGGDRAAESSAQGNNFGWEWFRDPRLDCLGYRGIFPSSTLPPLVEADKETDERNYVLWRLERGVAEGSTEIPKGEAIPLEYNFAGLNAISFEKGCYVGQELIARTHHRGVIRKRLTPLKFVDQNGRGMEQAAFPGSEIVDDNTSKKVGTVNTVLGCRGIGVLKLDEAFKESSSLSIKERSDVKVRVIRPDWWPAEWTPVHDNQTVAG